MFKKIIKNLILFIWCQPQTLIGLIAFLITRSMKNAIMPHKDVTIIYVGSKWGGISLGKFIFMCEEMMPNGNNHAKHEYGHHIQSFYLGPLFLLVIGIPSLTRAFYCLFNKESYKTYHQFYTEKWADELGNKKW